jgi:polyisoprenoid-binding protein YceI
MKKNYTTPQLTVHGTVEEVTQATKIFGRLDGTYDQNQVSGVDTIAS